MRTRSLRGGLLLGATLITAAAAVPGAASAATATVDVGAAIKSLKGDLDAYYPTKTVIRAGDKVTFVFKGFHTVTFLPKTGKPLALVVPTGKSSPAASDAAGTPFWWGGTAPQLGFNSKVIFPTKGATVSGTTLVNSGAPQKPNQRFTVSFPKAGTYRYICSIHPSMKGQVKVLPAGGTAPDAATLAKTATKEQAKDLGAARTAEKAAPGKAPANTVLAGAGATRYSLFQFFPKTLTVKAGTTVTFKMASKNEVHTITFASKASLKTLSKGTEPGPPPTFALDSKAALPSEPPGAPVALSPTLHGDGFLNSGFITDPIPAYAPPHSFAVTFTTPGTYHYGCLIHSGMEGDVLVTG